MKLTQKQIIEEAELCVSKICGEDCNDISNEVNRTLMKHAFRDGVKFAELNILQLTEALLDYETVTTELLEMADLHLDHHFEIIEKHSTLIAELKKGL
jgi:hypothetical protein